MSEEIKSTEKNDAVSMDEHNKIIGAHNTVKAENEELKKKLVEFENKNKVAEEKNEWQKVLAEQKKEMEELKKMVTEKQGETKVAKGIVQGVQQTQNIIPPKEEIIKSINQAIPTDSIKDVSNLSPIQRYGYYKAPTKGFTNQILGRALSLDASRQRTGQGENVSNYARASPMDTVVYAHKNVLG